MSDGPSSQRRTKEWPKPKSGGKPKRIATKNEPGGPHTPGAKAKKQPVGGGLLGRKPKPMTQKGNKAKTKSMTAKSITAEKLLKGRKPK